MQQQDLNIFMQSLRGNQPMIVLAFLLVRSSLSIEQLEALTGLHNDTVRAAVKGLTSKGLLYKQVGEHGRAIFVPAGDTFFGALFSQSPKTSDSALQSPKTSDSGGLIVVNVGLEESSEFRATTTTNRLQSPKTSDSGGRIVSVKTIAKAEEDITACLVVLREGGIYGKKANEIAEDWHIMPGDIEAQFAWAKAEDWDNPAGMVIYRLLNHVPAPPLQENGHVMDCKCHDCQINKLQRRFSDSDYGREIAARNQLQESEEE